MVVISETVNTYPNYTHTCFVTDYIFIGNATLIEFLIYTSSSAVLNLYWSSDGGSSI